jgi:hypothetical protein
MLHDCCLECWLEYKKKSKKTNFNCSWGANTIFLSVKALTVSQRNKVRPRIDDPLSYESSMQDSLAISARSHEFSLERESPTVAGNTDQDPDPERDRHTFCRSLKLPNPVCTLAAKSCVSDTNSVGGSSTARYNNDFFIIQSTRSSGPPMVLSHPPSMKM